MNETPDLFTIDRTALSRKDSKKGNDFTNFWLITCLPLMWKIFTRILSDKLYYHLQAEKLMPQEEKGCQKNRGGQKTNC